MSRTTQSTLDRAPEAAPVAPRATASGYRILPQLAGRWFLPLAFLARLPFSMTVIGVMLLVTSTSGSVARAGLATAACSVGTAVVGPLQGRLADRLGQRVVLLVAAPVHAVALVLVVLAALGDRSLAELLTVCVVAGASSPQVAAFVRVRWMGLTGGRPGSLRTAMAYESTADEVTFVLGPALVGVLASVAHPAVGLGVAAAMVAVLGVAVALHPTASAAPSRAGSASTARAAGMAQVARAVAGPVVGMLAVGGFFGGTQAAVTAAATGAGRPGLAGLLYALMGIGSAVTALAVVLLPDAFGMRARWLVGASGMAAGSGLSVLTGSLGPLALALVVTGLFVGPTLVTLFSLGSRGVDPRDGSTAMTLLISANVVGVAAGAVLGGVVADRAAGVAFVVPLAMALVLLGAGALTRTGRARAS
ncbi:Predicted arabinose efflux permease, MFS family [Flavimobilis marinus]|uniref:Predicted arabinose efflux permease, MFS family n=1 Tax=Flavimobilis marinus TaxID=285351 RepID=A0A1I2H7F8_9MICO|nr:MFS transporter [Flavimobilis marinus]SFF24937.1 Predicted arabinose efflux permease, MFS family [Flavimobilis marinus]